MSYRPITDIWILARPKVKYYGAYPNGFLQRARALLGVGPSDPVLHVCGGKVKDYPNGWAIGRGDETLDADPKLEPDFLQDASKPLPMSAGYWHAILIDPPYTEADADHYAPGREKLPNPNLLLRNAIDAVRPGGRVGMLHYIVPSPPKGVRFVACVGVFVGYNNRMRAFSVFEKPW